MGIVTEVLEITEERPDTDEAEPGIDEIELGITDGRLDEETPEVTEPEEPDEDTTKPDGIRLREDERSDAADVVPNKSPVPEDVQAETCVVTTIVGVTTAEPILVHLRGLPYRSDIPWLKASCKNKADTTKHPAMVLISKLEREDEHDRTRGGKSRDFCTDQAVVTVFRLQISGNWKTIMLNGIRVLLAAWVADEPD